MVNAQTFQKLFLLLPFAYPPTQSPASAPASAPAPAPHWSYADVLNWGVDYPTCNGFRQSPIHLKTLGSYALPLPPMRFGNYDIPLAGELTLTNNGHSVELEVPVTTNGHRAYITGGIMKSQYECVAVHFHWGSPGNKGSEHVIDNRRFDVEMHMVHKNVQYGTLAEATKHKDGVAVLGVMFKIVNNPDRYYPGLNQIFQILPDVTIDGSNALLNSQITLGQLLGDLNTKRFFTYSGSLTTPDCAEAVTWNVFPEPLPIAFNQIQKLWQILDSNDTPLLNNFRSLQARNKRPIFYRVGGFRGSNYIG